MKAGSRARGGLQLTGRHLRPADRRFVRSSSGRAVVWRAAAALTLVAAVGVLAIAARPKGTSPAPERPISELRASIETAVAARGQRVVGQPQCMRQALEQTVVPVPSFGWDCVLRIARHRSAPLEFRLMTLNVAADGCWRPEVVDTSELGELPLKTRLRDVRGCMP